MMLGEELASFTRLETSMDDGLPDILVMDLSQRVAFLEAKIGWTSDGGKVLHLNKLQASQVNWLRRWDAAGGMAGLVVRTPGLLDTWTLGSEWEALHEARRGICVDKWMELAAWKGSVNGGHHTGRELLKKIFYRFPARNG